MKPKDISIVQDRSCSSLPLKRNTRASRKANGSASASAGAVEAVTSIKRPVCYIPGEKPRVNLETEPPKLFIQGSVGSLKIDLRGIGSEVHQEAFALRVPDNALRRLGILRGDIAIVDPCLRILREGDLVMTTVEHIETIRPVVIRGKVTYCLVDGRCDSRLFGEWEQPIYGIVTGIFRLLDGARPEPDPRYRQAQKSKIARRPLSFAPMFGPGNISDANRLRDDPPRPGEPGSYRTKRGAG